MVLQRCDQKAPQIIEAFKAGKSYDSIWQEFCPQDRRDRVIKIISSEFDVETRNAIRKKAVIDEILKTMRPSNKRKALIKKVRGQKRPVSLAQRAKLKEARQDFIQSKPGRKWRRDMQEKMRALYKERHEPIIRDYLTGSFTQKELGQKYGLSQTWISRIVRNDPRVIRKRRRDILRKKLQRKG